MSKETIGPRIKKFRKEHKLTQEQLADSLGYSHKSVITNIEKGHSEMSYDKILLLIREYMLDANELFDVKEIDDLLEESKRRRQKNNEQFLRSAAIYKDKMEVLYDAKVIVFGVGGVGGHCIDSLARSGIGRIDIVDYDKIELTNINRQYVATHSSLGKYKVDVMKKHLLDVNPNIKVKAIKKFYLPSNEDEFDLSKYDYIVDCVDTVAAKLSIISKAKENNVPVISALGAGNKMDPSLLEISDISKTKMDPLAKVMRLELRKRGINHLKVVYSQEPPIKIETDERKEGSGRPIVGSNAFVPSSMGLLIASEVIKDIIK